MSAIEGTEVCAAAGYWIVPLSIIVLTLLFMRDSEARYGNSGETLCADRADWFLIGGTWPAQCIAISVTCALNAIRAGYVFMNINVSFIALSAVVLSITGVEALAADMGLTSVISSIRGVVYRGIAVVSTY